MSAGAEPSQPTAATTARRLTVQGTARYADISQDRLIRRLIMLVTELDLDRRDFVIFGSGPLLAHGLRTRIRDLDVVTRGTAWRRALQHGLPAAGTINGAPMALFWGRLIQFSAGWISPEWNTDDLIQRADIIHGLPFAQLTDVLAYKQALRRPKDRPDIEALLCRLHRSRSQEPTDVSGLHSLRSTPAGAAHRTGARGCAARAMKRTEL
jgi:hypothetical protein